ncbi:MAG: hypothetical protein V2A54_16540 [Bacteroidota bacterium]
MKKLILIPVLFLFNFCVAGTGSAYDGQFLIFAMVAFLLSIVFVIFLFDYFKKRIQRRREHMMGDEETHNL